MDYKISKSAYDIYAPVSLTNEIPPLNITGIRNRQTQLDWANDIIGFTKINYVEKTSTKVMDGVKSVNYKPEHLKFYDLDADEIIEGFLDKIDFEIGGNFVIECDYLMHEFHKYLFRLYPEHQNTLITLTKNERQGYFNEVGSLIHSHWDSSRLLYNDEDELLYLQHKLYTKLNLVRQNTGTAKNYEDLMRLLGISWVYSGYKLFSSNTGIGVPSLKEDDKLLDLTSELVFQDVNNVVIGDTLRILQGDDLQSPFRATYKLPISDNLDSFIEFQIIDDPTFEGPGEIKEKLNNIFKYGSPEPNEATIGSVSVDATMEELVTDPIIGNTLLYNPDKEFQRFVKSSDGYGIIPFKISSGEIKFEGETEEDPSPVGNIKEFAGTYEKVEITNRGITEENEEEGDEEVDENIPTPPSYTRVHNYKYLRTKTNLLETTQGKGYLIKAGELIWDENFLNYFTNLTVERIRHIYENSIEFKEKVDGVYRVLTAGTGVEVKLTVSLYDAQQRPIITALLKEEYANDIKGKLISGEDYSYRKLFEAFTDPAESNTLIYTDGVYYFGCTIHLLHNIDAGWNEDFYKEHSSLYRGIQLMDSDVLKDGEWARTYEVTWVDQYGIEEKEAFTVENYCQNTMSIRIEDICKEEELLRNISYSDTVILGEIAYRVINSIDIDQSFLGAIKQEDYKYALFDKLDIIHQVINKADCEVLSNGTIKTTQPEIKEILEMKGQLNFGLLLQGKKYYGTIRECYVENDHLILKIDDVYPKIITEDIYNSKGQFFYVNDMIEEGQYEDKKVNRRGYRITPCIFKGSVYYKCFWDELTEQNLNYYLSNIYSDRKLYTEDFLDIFRSASTETTTSLVDSGELVIYDSKMNPEVIKEFIDENKSIYRNVSLLKIIHIPLVLNTVIRNDAYEVTTAAYSNNIPVSGAFYNVDLKDLPKLTDFIDSISDEDYTDIKIISDITGNRLVTWGNAIWDTTENLTLKRFRAIWSGYYTSFEVTLTTGLFPDETELENLIDTNTEYEQSFILSPYNIDNYTKDSMGKWDVAFVIPDEGSTAIKNAHLFNYTKIEVEKGIQELLIPNNGSTLSKGSFVLTLDGLTIKNFEEEKEGYVNIDKAGSNLFFNYKPNPGSPEESKRLYSFDNILHLEGYTNRSYFRYSTHPEIAELLGYWIDKKTKSPLVENCNLSELLDKSILRKNLITQKDELPTIAIIEQDREVYYLMLYIITDMIVNEPGQGGSEITIAKAKLELSNVPISLLFDIGSTDTYNNFIDEIKCEGKRAAKIINKLISGTNSLISYPYFITQKELTFRKGTESTPYKVDDLNPATPILGRAAFTYNRIINGDEEISEDYNLTDNFLYFKEFIKVQMNVSLKESFKQYEDYILTLKNDTKLLDIDKNDFILLKDVHDPIKRASYTGSNEIFIIDRNVEVNGLNIAAIGIPNEENSGSFFKKVILRDTYLNSNLEKFDKEVGLDECLNSTDSTQFGIEENCLQIKNTGVSIRQYWKTSDTEIDYTYYKRKFLTKAQININEPSQIIIKDPNLIIDEHISRADSIDILITSGIKVIIDGVEATSFADYGDDGDKNYQLIGQVRTKDGDVKYLFKLDGDPNHNAIVKMTIGDSTKIETCDIELTAEKEEGNGSTGLEKILYVFEKDNRYFALTENDTYEFTTEGGTLSIVPTYRKDHLDTYEDDETHGYFTILDEEGYKLEKQYDVDSSHTITDTDLPFDQLPTIESIKTQGDYDEVLYDQADNLLDVYTLIFDTSNTSWAQFVNDLKTQIISQAGGEPNIVFEEAQTLEGQSTEVKLCNQPIVAWMFKKYIWTSSPEVTFTGWYTGEAASMSQEQVMNAKLQIPSIGEKTVIKEGKSVKVPFLDFTRPIDTPTNEDGKRFLELYYKRKISNLSLGRKIVKRNEDYLITYDPSCLGLTVKNLKDSSQLIERISFGGYLTTAFEDNESGNIFIFNDALRSKSEEEKEGSFYYKLLENTKTAGTVIEGTNVVVDNIMEELVKAAPEELGINTSDFLKEIKVLTASEYISPSLLMNKERQVQLGQLRSVPNIILNQYATTFYQRVVVQDFINTLDEADRLSHVGERPVEIQVGERLVYDNEGHPVIDEETGQQKTIPLMGMSEGVPDPLISSNSMDKVYKIAVTDTFEPKITLNDVNIEGELGKIKIDDLYLLTSNGNNILQRSNLPLPSDGGDNDALIASITDMKNDLISNLDNITAILTQGETNVASARNNLENFYNENKANSTYTYFEQNYVDAR